MVRDAVRSTAGRVVYALGLNLVVITLRVQPPWGGCPIAMPVNVGLGRKGDPTTLVEHAAAMIGELAGWLPERDFHLGADRATPRWPAPHCPAASSPRGCAATPRCSTPLIQRLETDPDGVDPSEVGPQLLAAARAGGGHDQLPFAGQSAELVHDIAPAADIVKRAVAEAGEAIRRAQALLGG